MQLTDEHDQSNEFLFFQIREYVKDVRKELSKPGFNSFGLGDCKAPKVLGDIFESIAGAIFLDSDLDTADVWKVKIRSIGWNSQQIFID